MPFCLIPSTLTPMLALDMTAPGHKYVLVTVCPAPWGKVCPCPLSWVCVWNCIYLLTCVDLESSCLGLTVCGNLPPGLRDQVEDMETEAYLCPHPHWGPGIPIAPSRSSLPALRERCADCLCTCHFVPPACGLLKAGMVPCSLYHREKQCLVYDWCLINDGCMNEWPIVPGIRGAWSYRASGPFTLAKPLLLSGPQFPVL